MNGRITEIWVYLSASPLFYLTLTLMAYLLSTAINSKLKGHPLANTVLISVLLIVGFLYMSHTPFEVYFEGAKFVHFLLGPATVALAIPLYSQLNRLLNAIGPLLLALVAGSVAAVTSVIVIGKWTGASVTTLMSMAPKSITTPIAMAVSEKIGGLPSLTAVIVILTGVLGAIAGQKLCQLLRCDDEMIQGFAIGLAAHGIGMARAFTISEKTGAFAALAMGLNGLLTAAVLPWLIPLLMPYIR